MDSARYPRILLILLVLLSAISILGETRPESVNELLRGPLPALALLALHVLIHVRVLARGTLYHGIQSLLIAAIGVVSASVSPVITLTAWMCGETVATEPRLRVKTVATTWHAAVGLGVIVVVAGAQSALRWIVAAVPTLAFVIVVILLYARESRARESAEELARELADSNRRIAEYAEQAAFRSRDEERRRMARDLHDTLAQGLTGVILQIRAAAAHLDGGRGDTAQRILSDSLEQAQQTLREARLVILDLREVAAPANGSGTGSTTEFFQTCCADLSRRYDTPVILDQNALEVGDAALAGSVLFELSSILKEAVHNAVRHGECRRVDVLLRSGVHSVDLLITDDGSGFDVNRIPERGHFGIRGMRERARALGAQLGIESVPGRGTTVAVVLPLQAVDNEEAEGV